jgi:hypothetical protein
MKRFDLYRVALKVKNMIQNICLLVSNHPYQKTISTQKLIASASNYFILLSYSPSSI